jgi:hypothetical protein
MRQRLHREEHRAVMLVLITFLSLQRGAAGGVPPAMPALANAMSICRIFPRPSGRASVAAMSVVGHDRQRVRPSRPPHRRRLIAPGDHHLRPSAANSLAVASPMPLLPPVINAVLFASLTIVPVIAH